MEILGFLLGIYLTGAVAAFATLVIFLIFLAGGRANAMHADILQGYRDEISKAYADGHDSHAKVGESLLWLVESKIALFFFCSILIALGWPFIVYRNMKKYIFDKD